MAEKDKLEIPKESNSVENSFVPEANNEHIDVADTKSFILNEAVVVSHFVIEDHGMENLDYCCYIENEDSQVIIKKEQPIMPTENINGNIGANLTTNDNDHEVIIKKEHPIMPTENINGNIGANLTTNDNDHEMIVKKEQPIMSIENINGNIGANLTTNDNAHEIQILRRSERIQTKRTKEQQKIAELLNTSKNNSINVPKKRKTKKKMEKNASISGKSNRTSSELSPLMTSKNNSVPLQKKKKKKTKKIKKNTSMLRKDIRTLLNDSELTPVMRTSEGIPESIESLNHKNGITTIGFKMRDREELLYVTKENMTPVMKRMLDVYYADNYSRTLKNNSESEANDMTIQDSNFSQHGGIPRKKLEKHCILLYKKKQLSYLNTSNLFKEKSCRTEAKLYI